MIKNERQYRITKAQAERFAQALSAVAADGRQHLHPALRKAEVEALRSQLADLKKELAEYDALSSGRRRVVPLDSNEALPKTLIQARIAAGLTQEELAQKLGLRPQQIQRYEATSYQSASLERINQIVRALGVKLDHPAKLRVAS